VGPVTFRRGRKLLEAGGAAAGGGGGERDGTVIGAITTAELAAKLGALASEEVIYLKGLVPVSDFSRAREGEWKRENCVV
jgi:hypothetical protein